MKTFLWCLRIPESILAFIGGALISYSINILTNTGATLIQNIIAGICFAASFLLVIWVWVLQKFEERYKKVPDENRNSSAWKTIVESSKKYETVLLSASIGTALCILAGVIIGVLGVYKVI